MSSSATNPIVPGFAPDPSVALIDGVFFLVNSSFHVFPGLPIYASRNLTDWTHIGNAFNRQSQLSLQFSDTKIHPQADGTTMLATGGLFAPTIRYHIAIGTTYVICTNVVYPEDGGDDICQNFIVSTKDIWSDVWSDPVSFDFRGIDPSIFWDDDGKAYICGSAAPGPMTKIHLFEVDLSTGQKLSEEVKVWDGTGGIYPEGPHLYKQGQWYYLLISEGGTWKGHMITVARAENIWGPYEEHKDNPIPTAKGTDARLQLVVQGPPIMPRHDADLLYLRNADLAKHKLQGSTVTLAASRADISQWSEPVTFIGKRQRSLSGVSTVTMEVPQQATSFKAGLVHYKDEHRYARMFFDSEACEFVFELVNKAKSIARSERRKAGNVDPNVRFKVTYTEQELNFAYTLGGEEVSLGPDDTAELSGSDFVGPIIGIQLVSDDSSCEVVFHDLHVE
ncbi:hypothetical protein OHC33_001560 [Knufia fluminis]|uniref:Beta-xylosidase C-terminal Concanavalin A-like domain-containing protein n=1 Tax=Knufia fluminis TaxID=191047 RepID=A0AAN8EJP8_9EURO|nr:hypothetical protein OHC33_001560 [Knufia fluminis]